MSSLVEVMKKAALDAVEASKPVNICFGVVTKAEPLEITIEQKMMVDSNSLILTNAVKEHTVEMSVDHMTESSGNTAHSHAYKGKKIFTVHNSLVVGEKVLLLRVQGGQKYLVVDRLT